MDSLKYGRSISLDNILSTENIYASYHKKEVLRGVSVTVSQGEIVSLIGPNGAGKSTLLRVIIGFLTPKEGKVCFLDENITTLTPHLRIRRGIGYLMQGGEIFRSLSVLENLELGGLGLPKSYCRERIDEVLGLFPILNGMESKRAGLLSGGARQALALGIVLVSQPKLLLLDEPSASLAPSLVKQSLANIQRISMESGVSILLVEQNIGEALNISQRVYILKNGEIAAAETPENLAQEKTLEDVFFT